MNIVDFFFFSSRRRHTRWTGDWSSDVCSSDLRVEARERGRFHRQDGWMSRHRGDYAGGDWNRVRCGEGGSCRGDAAGREVVLAQPQFCEAEVLRLGCEGGDELRWAGAAEEEPDRCGAGQVFDRPSASRTAKGVIGSWRTGWPMASATALAIAAATGTIGGSATPFAPPGPFGDGVSRSVSCTAGTSSAL